MAVTIKELAAECGVFAQADETLHEETIQQITNGGETPADLREQRPKKEEIVF